MLQKHPEESPSRDEPDTKRRKVRKGTQSCWECKRRKTRCVFTAPPDAVCDGCKRRGTACISQELPDEPTRPSQLWDRLSRVEQKLDELTAGKEELLSSSPGALSLRKHTDSNSLQRKELQKPKVVSISLPKNIPEGHSVSSQLMAAWPSQHDLDIILSFTSDISELLQCSTCTPYSGSPGQDAPSPRDILQLPLPGSHPVLIARKLLLLASFIQRIQPSPHPIDDLSVGCRNTLMSHIVDTVHNLITHTDDLVDSMEGVECLMIESMYHNILGNLRRSWRTMRRAMLLAQLMGLHRDSPPLARVKVIDPDTRLNINPSRIWFRLAQTDRYLSLMLGLPLGSVDDSFADPKALEDCVGIERVQRIQCVATGRLLQRDQEKIDDPAITNEIDVLLYEASCAMPAEWWLPLGAGNNEGSYDKFIRTMNLIVHYYLLVRLHLPYLLRFPSDRKYEYSKITAINASREALSQFVCFRESDPNAFYCRGVDFIVFISSTVLCIAHIESRRQRQRYGPGLGGSRGDAFFSSLLHQRLTDRGLMESALGGLRVMSSSLRYLLDIEASTAAGLNYSTDFFQKGGVEGRECSGDLEDGGNVLRIHIPYFGGIKIERDGTSNPGLLVPGGPGLDHLAPFSTPVQPENRAEGQQQPKLAENTPTRYQTEDHLLGPAWQVMPGHIDSAVQLEQPSLNTKSSSARDSRDSNGTQLFVPGLPAALDDWVAQGIGIPFYDIPQHNTVEEYMPM